jgi:CheY-like chemotaxis protein
MKILSVDDKSENLYMLEALLRGYGHQVDSARRRASSM